MSYVIVLLFRLSHFGKSGGESYLFDALHVMVSESDKKVIIIVRIDRGQFYLDFMPSPCQNCPADILPGVSKKVAP